MKKIGVVGTAEGSLGFYLCHNYSQNDVEYVPLCCDVRSEFSIIEAFKTTGDRPLDGIVYAAGIYRGGTIVDVDCLDWMDVLDINLVGAYRIMRKYASTVDFNKAAHGERTMVIVGASGGTIPAAGSSAYDVSKAGLQMLTSVAALEWAPYINVIQFDPGMIKGTGMWKATAKHYNNDEHAMEIERSLSVPAGRAMTLEEACDWIHFLITKGGYATGRSLQVDGAKTHANRR